MAVTLADVDRFFTYAPPTPAQVGQYQRIRDAARTFARILLAETPACSDQTTAIRHLRETVQIANSAIACNPPEPRGSDR